MGLPLVKESEKSKRELYEEAANRLWESASLDKIDPSKSAKGSVRIERTLALLEKNTEIKGKNLIDIGCGAGRIANFLADKGGVVTAIDIAENALRHCTHPLVKKIKGRLPYLSFEDALFDSAILTDVIAEIDPSLYRLTLSELARILKKEGWLICSTELDIYTCDTQKIFLDLIRTEFEIIEIKKSSHRLHFHLMQWAKAPFRLIRAAGHSQYRLRHLQKRRGLTKIWFYLNSIELVSKLWIPLTYIAAPLSTWLQKSRSALMMCEIFSKWLWREGGVTHLIVLARKRKI